MTRSLAALAALSLLSLAEGASAQSYAPSWGQPVYLDAWGRRVGGSPLSEFETRSYAETGRWADGTHERPRVYVPGQAPRHGYDRGYRWRGDRDRYARRDSHPYQGYRDEWGYNDDRARSGRRGYIDRGDVYLYDR